MSSFKKYIHIVGTSLVVQWLRFCSPNAGGLGLIPGQGTRFHMLQLRSCVPQLRPGTAKKKKKIYIYIYIHTYTVTLLCSYYHIHHRNSFHVINLKVYQLNNNTPFSSHSILWQQLYFVFTFFTTLLLSHFSRVWLCATLWTVAHQAPLSMRFSRQEYWNGLPCPFPGDLLNPRIEPPSPTSLALTGVFFTTSTTWLGTMNYSQLTVL